MRNNLIFFLLVFLIPVSCQKDSVPTSADGGKSIVCQVSVMGADDTKSLEVKTDSLKHDGQSFRMDAWLEAEHRGDAWPEFNDNPHYIKDAIMSYSSTGWTSSDKDVVWTNQIQTNFWAQYPDTLAGRGELTWSYATLSEVTDDEEKTPSFTYDMSAFLDTVEASRGRAAEVTSDMLVAYAREMYYAETSTTPASGGDLHFKFAHALSAIKFTQYDLSGIRYNIDTIRITGVYSKGECHLSGLPASGTSPDSVSVSWVGNGTLDSDMGFSQFTDFPTKLTTTYIFLIPQELKSEAKLIAKISARYVGDEENNGWYPVTIGGAGQEWKPGHIYNYIVKFDPTKHSMTVTVDEDGYDVETGVWDGE